MAPISMKTCVFVLPCGGLFSAALDLSGRFCYSYTESMFCPLPIASTAEPGPGLVFGLMAMIITANINCGLIPCQVSR